MVFRSENEGIHLPVSTARSMLYDGMRTAGVINGDGIEHTIFKGKSSGVLFRKHNVKLV